MELFSSIAKYLTPAPQQQATQPVQNPLLAYNDSVAQAKIDRSRAIAHALTKQAMEKQGGGQFFKSGDFTGFAGGATMGSALAQGLQGWMGGSASKSADEAAQQQGKDQIAAMQLRQGIMNGQLDQDGNPIPDPTDKANNAAVARILELNKQPSVNTEAPQLSDGTQPNSDVAQSSPVVAGNVETTNLTPVQSVDKTPITQSPQAVKAAQLLLKGAGGGRGGQGGPTAAQVQTEDASGYLPNESILDRAGRRLGVAGSTLKSVVRALSGADNNGVPVAFNQTAPAQPAPMPVQTPVAQPAPMPAPVQQPAMPNITAPVQAPVAQPAPMPVQTPVAQPAPVAPSTEQMGPGLATPAEIQAAMPPQQTESDQLANLMKLAQTGPQGQQIANAKLNELYGSKNGRYSTTVHSDPINGGFVQVTTDTATGRSEAKPLQTGGGSHEKVFETKEGANGVILERTASGWREARVAGSGAPVQTGAGMKIQQEQTEARTKDATALSDMKQRLTDMTNLIPLIEKNGTGRIQTPWNELKAYVTNSDDFDKMNRSFNQQQLQGAVDWLKGQGSVTDSERKILSTSQFDPRASTAANMAYADTVMKMMQRHIPLAEQAFTEKYGAPVQGNTPAPAAQNKPWTPPSYK